MGPVLAESGESHGVWRSGKGTATKCTLVQRPVIQEVLHESLLAVTVSGRRGSNSCSMME